MSGHQCPNSHKVVLYVKGFPGGAVVKNPPANAGDARDVNLIPESGDPLEKDMVTHSTGTHTISQLVNFYFLN